MKDFSEDLVKRVVTEANEDRRYGCKVLEEVEPTNHAVRKYISSILSNVEEGIVLRVKEDQLTCGAICFAAGEALEESLGFFYAVLKRNLGAVPLIDDYTISDVFEELKEQGSTKFLDNLESERKYTFKTFSTAFIRADKEYTSKLSRLEISEESKKAGREEMGLYALTGTIVIYQAADAVLKRMEIGSNAPVMIKLTTQPGYLLKN